MKINIRPSEAEASVIEHFKTNSQKLTPDQATSAKNSTFTIQYYIK